VRGVDLHAVETGLDRCAGGDGEAGRQAFNLGNGHFDRRSELAAGKRHRHGGSGEGRPIDGRRRLAPGMRQLGDGKGAPRLGRTRHLAEVNEADGIRRTIERDIARALEVAATDLHISGNRKADPALCPATVEDGMGGRGAVAGVGQPLRHGGFRDPVGKDNAAGQREGTCQRVHGIAIAAEAMTRRITLSRGAAVAIALLLAACGDNADEEAIAETGEAAIQRGIDLAVADVLAAEKAASAPLPEPEEAPAAE
jgi:hypothetical protein